MGYVKKKEKNAYLAKIFISIIYKSQSVFCKRVQNVQAVDFVPLSNGQIKTDKGQDIRLWNTQGRVEAGNKVWQLTKIDELCRMGIVSENKCA